MADQRITQLTALPKASVAATDVLPIADVSASQTKKVTAKDLVDAGLDLVDASSIDLAKLDQGSATKIGTAALADDAITSAKLADSSSVAIAAAAPTADNYEGRGWVNTSTGALRVYRSGAYATVTPELVDGSVTTAKLADGAVTTAKASNLGTAALADGAVTYAKLQDVSATDRLLGRSSAGAGDVQEIPCTAAGRALLDDADAAAQRATLGLGTLATQSGTFSGTHSGTTSGTNTGDQTITLTGEVTGSGTGSFAATIAANAVTEAKIASGAITTAKVADDAVTGAKLADGSASVVAASNPSGSGAFVGQQWVDTNTGIEYTWTGAAWLRQASLGTINFSDSTPLAFSVAYPDAYSATITTTLDAQGAARVFAGPATGADATPTFRALVPGDLPDATASTKGIIQPGTGLSVSSGTLNHSNSATAGTYTKLTVDAQGHATAGTTLSASDIPALDTSKITTGTFGTERIANDAITAAKLADYSTAKFGEAIPVADYIGQIFFNPLAEAFFLWDGNVWQPLGISAGAVIFAGTYNATTNRVASVTSEGTAIGLVVGSPLPAAVALNKGYYVVVSIGGTGVSPAPAVTLAPPDLILSNGTAWSEIDVSSTYVSQTASNVGFAASGSIGSTNVQAAIEEVSTECRNADNITSGTLLATRGGTGFGSYTKGDLLAASGPTALSKLGVGTNGQVLRANSATATGLEWGTDFVGTVTNVTSSTAALTVATGTTTPALTIRSATTSLNGIVQLSDSVSTTSSTLAATPTAVKTAYDLAAAAMPATGGTFTGDITMGANVGIQFEGSTDDVNETRLLAADPTADRLIYLPNADGTLVISGAIANADIAAGAAIVDTKLATISTAGKVSNSATTATNLNTASAIVARDASGNFSAGTITAALTGNASTATTLATGRTIALTGDVTGTSGTFNGSANLSFATTLANSGVTAGTYTKLTVDAKGRATAGASLAVTDIPDLTLEKLPDAWAKRAVRAATTANITLTGLQTIDGVVLVAGDRVLVKDQTTASENGIYVASGTAWTRAADADAVTELAGACVSVDSGTVNGGLRFDNDLKTTDTLGTTAVTWYRVLDANDTASTNTANKVVIRDASGNFSAGTITAALSGNASTATTLQTARTIQGVSFNGSANITVVTAGTGISVTGTAVANTGVLSVNGSTGAITNVAVTNAAQSFSAAQRGTVSALTDGATITPNFATANNFSVTLAGNRTLANPTNLTAGQSGTIVITQDATGSRTLAYGSNWKFPGGTAPTLTTTASAVDVISYYVESATRITARLISDVK